MSDTTYIGIIIELSFGGYFSVYIKSPGEELNLVDDTIPLFLPPN